MSSRKLNERFIDAYLDWSLKRWVAHQTAPPDGKAKLLQAAAYTAPDTPMDFLQLLHQRLLNRLALLYRWLTPVWARQAVEPVYISRDEAYFLGHTDRSLHMVKQVVSSFPVRTGLFSLIG